MKHIGTKFFKEIIIKNKINNKNGQKIYIPINEKNKINKENYVNIFMKNSIVI